MSQENVEMVRAGVAAMSRGDRDGLVALCAPDVVLLLQGALGEPVRYAGLEGIRTFFTDMGESWEAFGFDIADIHDLGETVLIVGTQWGRGRASGVTVKADRAGLISVRDGALCELRYFLDPDEALALAGLGG